MDMFNDPLYAAVFHDVFDHMPRTGPGSEESLLRALSYAINVVEEKVVSVLSLGCGSGVEVASIAKALRNARITAIDILNVNVEKSKACVENKGFGERVRVLKGDFSKLEDVVPGEQFDILWSEGAAYSMGFGKAIKYWREFIKPGGYLSVSEAVWLKDDPPKELKDFWDNEYPEMKKVDENAKIIEELGFKVVGSFQLPKTDWLDEFYDHMDNRISILLEEKFKSDAKACAVLDDLKRESSIYREYSDYFGYQFYVCRLGE